MVTTTEVGQLSQECNVWRDNLRSLRDDFTHFKSRLQQVAGRQTHREILQEIEHLDNQFHIQLINIHDLRHSIKAHDKRMAMEKAFSPSFPSESILAEHEQLHDEYESLVVTLRDISEEFENFLTAIR
jgi:seryl-tRNA synthetase